MNLPNKLTTLRVIMIPFFVFFMLTDVGGSANKWIALALFVVASLTDFLDGKIARKYHLVTNFGKFMDPSGRQTSGLLCVDLSAGSESGSGMGGHCDHCQRIYHQRIPSGSFRQWNRYCSQLLGQI